MSTIFLSETLKQVMRIAQAIARENYNETYGAPHILKALMHRETGLRDILSACGKDPNYFAEWAEIRIDDYPKVNALPVACEQDNHVVLLKEEANEVRIRLGLDEVTPLCALTALVKPHIAFSIEQLRSLNLQEKDLLTMYDTPFPTASSISNMAESKTSILQYCIDKTGQAAAGILDPIIGREAEMKTLIEILGRKNKPNVIITGEAGVGKTALVNGFAYEITNERVPSHLQNASLFELDMSAIQAGAFYKGEVEDRLKKVITELKERENTILFIDEINLLLNDKNGGASIANVLKPELIRGTLTVIATASEEQYRKVIQPETTFSRCFEKITLSEPSVEDCGKMLELLRAQYEKHHDIQIRGNAINETVRLAQRYIKDKYLPDAAFDLLDRTMSGIRLITEKGIAELENWHDQLSALLSADMSIEKKKHELKWLHRLLSKTVSPIIWGSLSEQLSIETIEELPVLIERMQLVYGEILSHTSQIRNQITEHELAAAVAASTGIPIGKIQSSEKDRLINMEVHLQKRVVGQDHALHVLADAVIESRSGIGKAGRPIGSFFLLGPTGTGKTELAKSIAAFLFNDESAMIRFDMSEFKEEHSAALLYGAPPGYVGYEEGGLLVNKIRKQPYSVVLFDEIEKAHHSVFDVFLQIMDEGKIHDKLGREGDFSNALILFTSNIGSQFIIEKNEEGILPTTNELTPIMAKYFRPEFLGRLTELIPFSPINQSMAVQIFDIQMQSLLQSLQKMGISLEIAAEARKHLALKSFDIKYGARQIAAAIRTNLNRPISRMIVKQEVTRGNKIIAGLNTESELSFEII